MDASKRDRHKNPAALDPRMVTLMRLANVRFLMGTSFLVHTVNVPEPYIYNPTFSVICYFPFWLEQSSVEVLSVVRAIPLPS